MRARKTTPIELTVPITGALTPEDENEEVLSISVAMEGATMLAIEDDVEAIAVTGIESVIEANVEVERLMTVADRVALVSVAVSVICSTSVVRCEANVSAYRTVNVFELKPPEKLWRSAPKSAQEYV